MALDQAQHKCRTNDYIYDSCNVRKIQSGDILYCYLQALDFFVCLALSSNGFSVWQNG